MAQLALLNAAVPTPEFFPGNLQFNVEHGPALTTGAQTARRDRRIVTRAKRSSLSLSTGVPYLSKSYPRLVCGGEMGIATDILNLRHNRISSVTMLISAIERYYASPSYERAMNRRFQVEEAVDLVLTNVAAHAAEALVTQQPITGR